MTTRLYRLSPVDRLAAVRAAVADATNPTGIAWGAVVFERGRGLTAPETATGQIVGVAFDPCKVADVLVINDRRRGLLSIPLATIVSVDSIDDHAQTGDKS